MFTLPHFGDFRKVSRAFQQAEKFAFPELPPESEKLFEELRSFKQVITEQEYRSSRALWLFIFKRAKRAIGTMLGWSVFAALATLLAIIATRSLVESSHSLTSIFLYIALFFAGELSCNFARYKEVSGRGKLGFILEATLYQIVNSKLRVLDPYTGARTQLSKGNLKTLVGSDIENINEFALAAAANWVPVLMLLLILTPALYIMTGVVGLIGIGIMLLQVPSALLFGYLIEICQVRIQHSRSQVVTRIGEWLKNMRLVRYLGWQDAFRSEIAKALKQYSTVDLMKHLFECLVYAISTSWWMMPILGVLIASEVLHLPLSVGALFGAIWALGYLSYFVMHLPYSITLYGSAATGITRIRELMSAAEITAHVDYTTPPVALGAPLQLHLKDLRAGYDTKEELSIPALTLNLNELTAIVGEVGAGKSTLLRVLSGDLAPLHGSIEIEDERGVRGSIWIHTVREWWRSQIAIVPQESFLSNSSFLSNIILEGTQPGQTPSDDLLRAASQAQLTSDVALFTHGYHEEVGETGINLSGGQKSRVSLARAFYSGRRIFFLDDPLSAVDARTEKRLMQAFEDIGCGGVLVSHRVQELTRCSRVIVLEKGSIVEDGDPHTLLNDRDSYFSAFVHRHELEQEAV